MYSPTDSPFVRSSNVLRNTYVSLLLPLYFIRGLWGSKCSMRFSWRPFGQITQGIFEKYSDNEWSAKALFGYDKSRRFANCRCCRNPNPLTYVDLFCDVIFVDRLMLLKKVLKKHLFWGYRKEKIGKKNLLFCKLSCSLGKYSRLFRRHIIKAKVEISEMFLFLWNPPNLKFWEKK